MRLESHVLRARPQTSPLAPQPAEKPEADFFGIPQAKRLSVDVRQRTRYANGDLLDLNEHPRKTPGSLRPVDSRWLLPRPPDLDVPDGKSDSRRLFDPAPGRERSLGTRTGQTLRRALSLGRRENSEPSSKGSHRADDAVLVDSVLTGDLGAVEALATRMARVPAFLQAINRRRGGHLTSHDIDDLSQDVVIKVWNKLDKFHGRGSLDNWIYRFALLEFMNGLRRRIRQSRIAQVPAEVEQPHDSTLPGLEELLEHLAALPTQESEVIEMHHFEGADFGTVGARLGIPRGTAKTRYYRGLVRLREKLKRVFPEEWA